MLPPPPDKVSHAPHSDTKKTGRHIDDIFTSLTDYRDGFVWGLNSVGKIEKDKVFRCPKIKHFSKTF